MLGMALSLLIWLAPLQIVLGDLHGLNTLKYEPAKIAALRSALGDRARDVPLILFAFPDPNAGDKFETPVPAFGSLILTHEWGR